jgi:hypothetical protein
LESNKIGIFAYHHKPKPLRGGQGQNHRNNALHEVMYDTLGGSVLTNFFRGIIIATPLANSKIFKFTLAKRFEESQWPLQQQQFRWHEDRSKRLWVPASAAETSEASKTNGKTIGDLYKLLPTLDTIHRDQFELLARKNGFTRPEYRGLLAEACRDDAPDDLRIHRWEIYTGKGAPTTHYARFSQPDDQKPDAIKAQKKANQARNRP